jgi:predicted nuclease of restriction endonuclease-like (RecB) superfamily
MTNYHNIIADLKKTILNSRFQAARMVNKELILLYFSIGSKISETARKEAWGAKVLDQISAELQRELPGLRGFSSGNLKKMRVFAEFWRKYVEFGSALPNQILVHGATQETLNELPENFSDLFFSVSFTHHFCIATKCQDLNEAIYYLSKTYSEFWNYRHLEKQINDNSYQKIGFLPNNFKQSLSEKHQEKALKIFKDEYLLDFINIQPEDEDDEKVLEHEIVRNIRKFILSLGNDFAFIGNQFRIIVDDNE